MIAFESRMKTTVYSEMVNYLAVNEDVLLILPMI